MRQQVRTDDNLIDRHDILGAVKRRFGSLTALARLTGTTQNELSVALGSPYQKGEAIIAAALGRPVQELWPDRYMPDGRRRRFPSRRAANGASLKQPAVVDGGDA